MRATSAAQRWYARVAAVALALPALAMVSAGGASATFPGANGLIAGARYNGSHWEVYTMRSDGTHFRSLTPTGHNEDPDWSPDGKRIAYGSDASGSHQVHIMNADGTHRRLVSHNLSYAAAPQWSPDGKWLTFAGSFDGNLPGDIYVVRPNGTGQRNITNTLDWDDGYHGATWSPDGKRIAFDSLRNGTADIYTAKPDGSDLKQITRGAADDRSPDWSPDGRTLVFYRTDDSSQQTLGTILTVPSGGGTIRQLTRNPANGDANPTWSPDGKQILFARLVNEPANHTYDLFRLRLSDRKLFRVTRTSPATEGPTSWQRVLPRR